MKWGHGDVFAIPLVDGSFGLVQAVDHWMPHWIYTAITMGRIASLTDFDSRAKPEELIALLAVDDDPFNFGGFPHLGPAPAIVLKQEFPNEDFAQNGYIGAKSYSSGVIVDFLSAWHRLAPWNAYKDPAFFDKLLISGIDRPSNVIMNSSN